MFQHRTHSQDSGVSLLVAIIVVAVVMFISAAVSGMSFNQLQLTSIGENSQYAFYAADSGIECALYWDLLHDAFPSPDEVGDGSTGDIECNDNSSDSSWGVKEMSVDENVACDGGTCDITTFKIVGLLSEPEACAQQVTVTETQMSDGRIRTDVESLGRNDCSNDADPDRTVERAVRVTY
ncbi:MAG: hypothetical protein WDZ82_02595 [Candidatus Paceibacterota bacterium]